MNPETLREQAEYYRLRDDFGDDRLAEIFDAAADAWEKGRERSEALERENSRLRDILPVERPHPLDTIFDLRTRLVQMERALADRDRRIDEGDAIPASFYKRLEAAEKENAAATKWAGEQGWIVEPWLERAR